MRLVKPTAIIARAAFALLLVLIKLFFSDPAVTVAVHLLELIGGDASFIGRLLINVAFVLLIKLRELPIGGGNSCAIGGHPSGGRFPCGPSGSRLGHYRRSGCQQRSEERRVGRVA